MIMNDLGRNRRHTVPAFATKGPENPQSNPQLQDLGSSRNELAISDCDERNLRDISEMFALVTDSAPFQAHSTQQQAKLP